MIRIQKLVAIAIVVLGTIGTAYGQTWTTGVGAPGTNLTATLSGGTLTISGSGAMANFSNTSTPPWHDSRNSITAVVTEEGVTSIGNRAFIGYTDLVSVTIRNQNVTTGGNTAFSGCTGLKSITVGAVTAALNNNGTLTVSGSGNMPNLLNFGSAFSAIRDSITAITIQEGVTSIAANAFASCRNITTLTIPNSVTSIGADAFRGCRRLTTLTIPNNVTTIGRRAFSNCDSLTTISIGSGVDSIGTDAFFGCTHLTSINVASNNAHFTSEGGVLFNKDKTVLILYPPSFIPFAIGVLVSYAIPNGVTTIETNAFHGNRFLNHISIPASVTTIRYGAFHQCAFLSSIAVAEDNANFSSADGVLFNKNKNVLIQYPTGRQGGYIVPESVDTIALFAFNNSAHLTSVIIPDNVKFIGMSAFSGCANLVSATIGNGVTSIEDYAFAGNTAMTTVVIGSSVNFIGYDAFFDCIALISVTSLNPNPPYISMSVFNGVNAAAACLYVPEGRVGAYFLWGADVIIMPPGKRSVTAEAQSSIQTSSSQFWGFNGFTCINPVTSIANVNRVNPNSSIPAVSVRGRTLNVKSSQTDNLQVRMIDMRGRTAASFKIVNGADNNSFSLTKMPAGRYIVEVRNAGGGRVNSMPVVVR